MRILIYIPNTGQNWGGIRQYEIALLNMLSRDKEFEYFIYHDSNDPQILEASSKILRHTIVTTEEIKILERKRRSRLEKLRFLVRNARREKNNAENLLSFYCREKRIQIVHCPYQHIPAVNNVKLITTMHDVQELHFPEFFSPEERAYRAQNHMDALRRADSVVVSYNHVKNDLIKYFHVPENKIQVILLQMDKLWFQDFLGKLAEPLPHSLKGRKYIFYPANAWQHKNHLRLLEALAWLRDKEGLCIDLVCTGHFDNEQGDKIIKSVNALQLGQQVSILGIVEEEILYSLYKNAVAVVIPTIYEAGSFPLMESLFLEVPVICSNITSLPETIGDDKFLFDPENILSMAEMIKKIYLDSDFRNSSVLNGAIQRENLKKTNALNLLIENYLSLIG